MCRQDGPARPCRIASSPGSAAEAGEGATGVKPRIAVYYSSWNEPFSTSFAQTARENDAYVLVQLEPKDVTLASIAAGGSDAYLRSYADAVVAFGHPVIPPRRLLPPRPEDQRADQLVARAARQLGGYHPRALRRGRDRRRAHDRADAHRPPHHRAQPRQPDPGPDRDSIRPCAVRHPDTDTGGDPDRHDDPDGDSHRHNESDSLPDTGNTDTVRHHYHTVPDRHSHGRLREHAAALVGPGCAWGRTLRALQLALRVPEGKDSMIMTIFVPYEVPKS
jgi:hypothetical protein